MNVCSFRSSLWWGVARYIMILSILVQECQILECLELHVKTNLFSQNTEKSGQNIESKFKFKLKFKWWKIESLYTFEQLLYVWHLQNEEPLPLHIRTRTKVWLFIFDTLLSCFTSVLDSRIQMGGKALLILFILLSLFKKQSYSPPIVILILWNISLI